MKKSAFPHTNVSKHDSGISERLYIATQIVAGIDKPTWITYMQDCQKGKDRVQYVVEESYKIADELIKQDNES